MPSLNLDINYFDHIKVKRLVGLLGPGAEILPIKLWAYCAKHCPVNGSLNGHSIEEIEHVMGWNGEKGRAVDSFTKINLLKKIKNGYKIHKWEQHEGHLRKFHLRALRANFVRWNSDPTRTPKDS